jgi:hypothetical protein
MSDAQVTRWLHGRQAPTLAPVMRLPSRAVSGL